MNRTITIEGLDEAKFSKEEIRAIETSGTYLLSVCLNLGYNMKIHVSKPSNEDRHFMFEKFDVLIAEEKDSRFKQPFLLVGDSQHFKKALDDNELSSLVDGSLQPGDCVGEGFKATFQKYCNAKELHKELSANFLKNNTRSKALKI